MSRINPEQSVIVFDLDDTLYAEYEYKCSGIRAVTALVAKLYPEFGETELLEKIDADGNGWLDELCALCNFNSEEKKSLLWYYRLHTPVLTPYWHPQKLAAFIRRFAAAALITDGRSLTQRLKLDALGIRYLFDEILVSESSGQEKPDGGRFYLLEKKYGMDKRYIYVGDNIKKDFVTPKKMGWLTIGLKAASRNIHPNDPADFAEPFHPHLWIDSLPELAEIIT
jgi:HAD hydrolase, family IA, variant 1